MLGIVEVEAEGGMYLSSSCLIVVTLFFNDHISIDDKVCLVLKVVDKAPSRLDIYIFPIQRFSFLSSIVDIFLHTNPVLIIGTGIVVGACIRRDYLKIFHLLESSQQL